MELQARHAKLIQRREDARSAALYRSHTQAAHATRTRGAHR